TGIIEGNTIFPAAFPSSWLALFRIALKRAPEANYHLTFLPKVAPWLAAFHAASRPERLVLGDRAHEALVDEAGAERYIRRNGWLKLYRGVKSFAAQARERDMAA